MLYKTFMPRHAMGDYAWYIVGQVMKLPVLSAINDNIRWHIMPSSNSNSSSTSNFQLSSSNYKFKLQVQVQAHVLHSSSRTSSTFKFEFNFQRSSTTFGSSSRSCCDNVIVIYSNRRKSNREIYIAYPTCMHRDRISQ